MAVSRRILIPGILIALMIAALAAGLILLCWPTLLNGHAGDLTIESLAISPAGEIDVMYRTVMAYGTELVWLFPGAPPADRTWVDSWDSCPPGFLRRPRTSLLGTYLIPLTGAAANEKPDRPSMQAALVLQPGTYRVRPGDQLVFFRLKLQNGGVLEGKIKVRYSN